MNENLASEHIFSENDEIIKFFKESRLFSHLPDNMLGQLTPLTQIESYFQGDVILKEGQMNDKVFFLIRGRISVYSEGHAILKLQRIGDIFGEMSVISLKPCAATVQADTEIRVFSLRANDIGRYSDLDAGDLKDTLHRLFSMILTEKLSLTTHKAKKFEETNRLLEQQTIELQTINDELRIARDHAEKANRAKTQFLANMSHEIRTPLNAIVGFSQIMLNQLPKSIIPNNFRQYLENIRVSGRHLSEIINNILDLSKIEAGKMSLSNENINLKLMVQGMFHVHKDQAIRKNIHFNYNIHADLPNTISADRTKLNQILMNLINNAIKFTPPKKSVELNLMRSHDELLIQVKDQGIGIPADQLSQIFQPFEQADNSAVRRFEGTGLGLTIVKSIVDLMHGTIQVSSIPNEGTCFEVRLPISDGVGHSYQDENVMNDPISFPKDVHILVVEDNPINQQMMFAMLSQYGISIELASSGKEAIQRINKNKPDLIFMDIHMPEMDGLMATRQIREMDELREIPIIALSADAFINQQEEAFKSGITDYLAKPVEQQMMISKLKKYLLTESQNSEQELNRLRPSLPTDSMAEIQEILFPLADVSLVYMERILDEIQRVKNIMHGHQTPFNVLLPELEQAVWNGNDERFRQLLKEILAFLVPL